LAGIKFGTFTPVQSSRVQKESNILSTTFSKLNQRHLCLVFIFNCNISSTSIYPSPKARYINRITRPPRGSHITSYSCSCWIKLDFHRRLLQHDSFGPSSLTSHQPIPWHRHRRLTVGKWILWLQRRQRIATSRLHTVIKTFSRFRPMA
jgi:hypothetical protein